MTRTPSTVVVSLCTLGMVVTQSGHAGSLDWSNGFAMPGASDAVHTMAMHDDGSGPGLYIGGEFAANSAAGIGDSTASYLVKWDGVKFSGVGTGVGGPVYSLTSGKGVLFVGGGFTHAGGSPASYTAFWNGQNWSPLGSGVNGSVRSLVVFDDGFGESLFAGGFFTQSGGAAMNSVARWDGTNWHPVGNGLLGFVWTLTVFDDGTGPALYAGGLFSLAPMQPLVNLAKWDGTQWIAVGGGVDGTVYALRPWDDGRGPSLFVGGAFIHAGSLPASNIARWDGASWSSVGGGVSGGSQPLVYTFGIHDDGSGTGPCLYAGGRFLQAGATSAVYVAKWTGKEWSPLGSGVQPFNPEFPAVRVLESFDNGAGPVLFVGGAFQYAGGIRMRHIATWNGAAWSTLGVYSWIGGEAHSLQVHDDGHGQDLFVGGEFTLVGSPSRTVTANNIARWDGTNFSPVGNGLGNRVYSLCVFDDNTGSGSRLYAGGTFSQFVAVWNGSTWSPVGGGILGLVNDLEVFDDGSGPALYAVGDFVQAGGIPATYIAKWNGTAWSPVGGGLGSVSYAPVGYSLGVFDDDGDGPLPPALYVGGRFNRAGGVPVTGIARWDGTAWTSPGVGLGGSTIPTAWCMKTFDDGSGMAMYVGGNFRLAGGIAAESIARWNGTSWTALAGGTTDHEVKTMAVFADGSGSALYAGGYFTTIEGVAAKRVARWNGVSWTALGEGISGAGGLGGDVVRALAAYDAGSGPALYAVGSFLLSGGTAAQHFAAWTAANQAPSFVTQPGGVTASAGQEVQVSCQAQGSVPLGYQWRKDGMPLTDNSEYSGTTQTVLTIHELEPGHEGIYDVAVANLTGITLSIPAEVGIQQQCAPDITPGGGNGVVDLDDLLAIINNWGQGLGNPADVTSDGSVDIDDLLFVINNWGPCP